MQPHMVICGSFHRCACLTKHDNYVAECGGDLGIFAHASSNHRIAQKVSKTAKGKDHWLPRTRKSDRSSNPRFDWLDF